MWGARIAPKGSRNNRFLILQSRKSENITAGVQPILFELFDSEKNIICIITMRCEFNVMKMVLNKKLMILILIVILIVILIILTKLR